MDCTVDLMKLRSNVSFESPVDLILHANVFAKLGKLFSTINNFTVTGVRSWVIVCTIMLYSMLLILFAIEETNKFYLWDVEKNTSKEVNASPTVFGILPCSVLRNFMSNGYGIYWIDANLDVFHFNSLKWINLNKPMPIRQHNIQTVLIKISFSLLEELVFREEKNALLKYSQL